MMTFTQNFYNRFLSASMPEGLRVGQWFYDWAALYRVENPEDKAWCDKLYELDKIKAHVEIQKRIDWTQ